MSKIIEIIKTFNVQLALKNIYTKIDEIIKRLNDNEPKYKVYVALLTQSGTDAPTAIVLENTIGDIVWVYNDVGQYSAILNGAFPINKTGCFISGSSEQSNCPSFIASAFSNIDAGNGIYVQCSGAEYGPNYYTDDALQNTMIEIRVYN